MDSEWKYNCLKGEMMIARDYIYLVEADTRLRSECMRRLVDLYGENIPEDILSRVLLELRILQENNCSDILLYHGMMCSELDTSKGEILVRGGICIFYIAYLLGVTNVNPMEVNVEIFPEYFADELYYWDIDICVPLIHRNKLHSILSRFEGVNRVVEISDYITEGAKDCGLKLERLILVPYNYSFEEKNDRYKIEDDELIIKTVPSELDFNLIKIEVNYTSEISMLNSLVQTIGMRLNDISYTNNDNCSIFNIYDDRGWDIRYEGELEGWLDLPGVQRIRANSFKNRFEITSFMDLIRAFGLMYGVGTWYDNGYLRLLEGATLEDVFSCREDIYDFLRKKGISTKESNDIVRFVCSGKTRSLALKKNYSLWQSYERILKEHDIDGFHIEVLRAVRRVMRKGQLISMATEAWQLGYFKKTYLDIYKEVYKQYMI